MSVTFLFEKKKEKIFAKRTPYFLYARLWLSTKLYWLFIDAIDCLAMVENFITFIVH